MVSVFQDKVVSDKAGVRAPKGGLNNIEERGLEDYMTLQASGFKKIKVLVEGCIEDKKANLTFAL